MEGLKMAIKPVIDLVRTHGPAAGKFVKENWKEIAAFVGVAGSAAQKLNANRKEKKKNKFEQGEIHFRKKRYIEYKSKILASLDSSKRKELFHYKLEIEQFIKQIENEQEKELAVKKPVHLKRINNWKEVLVQIEDKMMAKDYEEYLMLFNNTDYNSTYFEGYELKVDKFKEMVKKQETKKIIDFINQITNRNIEDIKEDFSY